MREARVPDAMTATALVSADQLLADLDRPDVRVVEVDVDTTLYAKEHIPGAVGWDWTKDLNDPVTRDVVSKEGFEALLSRSGIAPETTVVLYGDHHNWFAAYAAWLLESYGHAPERVKLLDGGRALWTKRGLPVTEEAPSHAPTAYRVTRVRAELRARRDDVLARAPGTALVDVRSPDEYTGKVLAPPGLAETALRGGHVPGAVNVPWSKAVREDGTFRDATELRALYAPVLDAPRIVAYCRIGERSAHTWFVLRRILGHPDVRNYDGSWTEYGNLVGAPIAVGAAP